MNTFDARLHMRDLARDGLRIVRDVLSQGGPRAGQRAELRDLASQARSSLIDAGYPGDAAWRALQGASIGMDTASDVFDVAFWSFTADDLLAAIDALDSLIGPTVERDADINIVG